MPEWWNQPADRGDWLLVAALLVVLIGALLVLL